MPRGVEGRPRDRAAAGPGRDGDTNRLRAGSTCRASLTSIWVRFEGTLKAEAHTQPLIRWALRRVVKDELTLVAIDDALSDEALLVRLTQRDEEALALLYDRHGRAAYALARQIVRDAERAEDVVQEAFLAVWRRAETFRLERGSARSWLLAVTRNRAIDAIRGAEQRAGRYVSVAVEELPLMAPDDPEGDTLRQVEGRLVRQALAELPPEQREVVTLAYFGGLSYPEVAERMGIPLGTVKSRMRLALERLRTLMIARDIGT